VKEGDALTVLVEDIDAQGKISLKPVGDEWAIPEGQTDESGRGRSGGRDRDRGDRGDRGSRSGGGRERSDRGDRSDRRGRRFRDERSDEPGGDTPAPAEVTSGDTSDSE
jgi:hypothetical protein